MVLYIVCGVLLSIFILCKSNHVVWSKDSSNVNKSRSNILQEICKDLTYLFKSQKSNSGKFIGTLKPLNNVDKILDNLLIVEDKESFTINKKVIHFINYKFFNLNEPNYLIAILRFLKNFQR